MKSDLDDVGATLGATLVVALVPANAVRGPGDHKAGSPKSSAFWGALGRPYSGQRWRTFNPLRLVDAID